jgi:hypothetical protein
VVVLAGAEDGLDGAAAGDGPAALGGLVVHHVICTFGITPEADRGGPGANFMELFRPEFTNKTLKGSNINVEIIYFTYVCTACRRHQSQEFCALVFKNILSVVF